jgi:hypothetical protein
LWKLKINYVADYDYDYDRVGEENEGQNWVKVNDKDWVFYGLN